MIDRFRVRLDMYRINVASYHFNTLAFLPFLAAAKTVGQFPEPGNVINVSSIGGISPSSIMMEAVFRLRGEEISLKA